MIERLQMARQRLNASQMETLERIIATSPDVKTDIARKAVIWLLRHTEGLTRSVVLNIPPEYSQEAGEIQNAVHEMVSSGRRTHLNRAVKVMASPMMFDHHSGHFLEPVTDRTASGGSRIWISQAWYDPEAERFEFDPALVSAVQLLKS